MHLISKGMYEAKYAPQGDLVINPMEESLFTPSCYYFRLGAIAEGENVIPLKELIKLRKHETKRVFSLEVFTLSEKALGFFGPCSELLLKGFLLHHSPTIDPGFSGSLELLLENRTNEILFLNPSMVIGKAIFFDVSDTLMNLDTYVRLEKQKAVWVERKKVGEKIKEAAIWVEKTIDTEEPKQI